jgi:hypothetical protein
MEKCSSLAPLPPPRPIIRHIFSPFTWYCISGLLQENFSLLTAVTSQSAPASGTGISHLPDFAYIFHLSLAFSPSPSRFRIYLPSFLGFLSLSFQISHISSIFPWLSLPHLPDFAYIFHLSLAFSPSPSRFRIYLPSFLGFLSLTFQISHISSIFPWLSLPHLPYFAYIFHLSLAFSPSPSMFCIYLPSFLGFLSLTFHISHLSSIFPWLSLPRDSYFYFKSNDKLPMFFSNFVPNFMAVTSNILA